MSSSIIQKKSRMKDSSFIYHQLKKKQIVPRLRFFFNKLFKPSQLLQWLAPEPSASPSLCLEVSLGRQSTPSPPELAAHAGKGSSKKSQVWKMGKSSSQLPLQLPFKGDNYPDICFVPWKLSWRKPKRSQPLMAETPSVENPTTSSTVSQRFLSADQILAPPQDTRKIKHRQHGPWMVCGLFQAGCEHISQELHVVMSNLIFEWWVMTQGIQLIITTNLSFAPVK